MIGKRTRAPRRQKAEITGHGIGCRHQGRFARLPSGVHHHRLGPQPGTNLVAHGERSDLERAGRTEGQTGGEAVGKRTLRDHGSQPVVVCRGCQHMTTAEGGSPDDDAAGIDIVAAAGKSDGGLPVLQLLPDIQQLARLAFAVAEVAVIKDQTGVAGGTEALGEGIKAHDAGAAQTMGHDDHGRRTPGLGQVKPGAALFALRGEADIKTGHGASPEMLKNRYNSKLGVDSKFGCC